MVRLEQIASEDFLLVRADEPVEHVLALLAAVSVTRVVVERWLPGCADPLRYVFPPDQLVARCEGKTGTDLQTAADLHEWQAAPALAADAPARNAPDVCVVLRDGELTGFCDADIPPNEIRSSARSEQPRPNGSEPFSDAVRHVHADFPESVAKDETVPLLVSLRATRAGSADVPVSSSGGVIDVVVRPERGFVLLGQRSGKLPATEAEEAQPLFFKLKATELGAGRIKVFCYQGGVALGMVTVYATVLAERPPGGDKPVATTGALGPSPLAAVDLELGVREWPEGSGYRLEYTLRAADPAVELNAKRFYADPFQSKPQEYFQQFYSRLDRLKLSAGGDAEQQLADYGAELFEELFPEDLRAKLWDLRDRIKSVHVHSEEPWVPWELVRLSGQADGRTIDGQFLCEAFHLTRWFPGVGRRPELRLRQMAVVAPSDSKLASAAAERQYLQGLAVPGRRKVDLVSARYATVRAELLKGDYDGWHFVGHALADQKFPSECLLRLEGSESLRASAISGAVKNCGKTRPLVFLNGCQTGQAGTSLTGLGGWAAKFIEAGAAVFVGSLWSVDDAAAFKFAAAFYDQLLGGRTVAEAVTAARAAAGPTGLAYAVFSDPFTRVI